MGWPLRSRLAIFINEDRESESQREIHTVGLDSSFLTEVLSVFSMLYNIFD